MSKAALEDALRACGGSNARLAEKVGVSRQVVWNWRDRGFVPRRNKAVYSAVLALAKQARK
jgi:hypothetical protein